MELYQRQGDCICSLIISAFNFETGMPNIKIRFKGQHLDMDNAFYSRAFTVHFSYRFGGYTKKESKSVDTSRFGM